MKVSLTIATVVLALVTGALGQASQTQSQPNSPSTAQPGGMRHHHHHHCGRMQHNCAQMKEHMQEMQTLVQQLQTRAGKLRADAQSVQDMATRTALLDDADMWTQMIGHMQDMLQHMQGMSGAGMGRGCRMKGGMMGPGMKGGMGQGMMGQPSGQGQTPGSTPQ